MRGWKAVIAGVLWAMALGASAGKEPELGGNCAMSLSTGVVLPTDCSIFWISGDDKLYCFMNPLAKAEFVQSAEANLAKARAFWEDPAFWERRQRAQEGGSATN